jgi:hypothetical protein
MEDDELEHPEWTTEDEDVLLVQGMDESLRLVYRELTTAKSKQGFAKQMKAGLGSSAPREISTATNGTTSPNSSVTMQTNWINSLLTSALEPYADRWKDNNRQQGGATSQSGSSMSEQSAYVSGRSSQSTGKANSTGVSMPLKKDIVEATHKTFRTYKHVYPMSEQEYGKQFCKKIFFHLECPMDPNMWNTDVHSLQDECLRVLKRKRTSVTSRLKDIYIGKRRKVKYFELGLWIIK